MKQITLISLAYLSFISVLSAQVGRVGINTTAPRALLHVKDSSVLLTGPVALPQNPGPTPWSGIGARTMWYADKAAFRTGGVDGNHWDRDSIGKYSFAAGLNTKAIGLQSTAFGQSTEARGNRAFASGHGTIASGFSATSHGSGTHASGYCAFASGSDSYSTGYATAAFGIGTSSEAWGSLTAGLYTRAIGDEAVALNSYTEANGWSSTALGYETIANATACLAIGVFNDPILESAEEDYFFYDHAPLFTIGHGSDSTNRRNAMVVLLNGNTGLGTNTPMHRLHAANLSSNSQIAKFSSGGGYSEILVDNGSYETDLGISNEWGYVGTKDPNDFCIRTNSVPRLYLTNATGNVGIGTTSPSFKLHVNGDAGKPGGGSWTATSDARLKKNVQDFSDGLSAILQIHPVSYHYTAESGYDPTKRHIGVIAQELESIAPYMVSTSTKSPGDGSSPYLQVDNSAMVYMLINAVQELAAKVELQQALIEELTTSR